MCNHLQLFVLAAHFSSREWRACCGAPIGGSLKVRVLLLLLAARPRPSAVNQTSESVVRARAFSLVAPKNALPHLSPISYLCVTISLTIRFSTSHTRRLESFPSLVPRANARSRHANNFVQKFIDLDMWHK